MREKIDHIVETTAMEKPTYSSTLQQSAGPEPFQMIQQQQAEGIREYNDIQARRLNVIVFGLGKDQSIDTVREALEIDEAAITDQITLKSKGKNQPIKVQVADERTKWYIIAHLHRKLDKVYARPDLTPKQQQADRELVKDLQEKRKLNDGKTYKIHRGKIVATEDSSAAPKEAEEQASPSPSS